MGMLTMQNRYHPEPHYRRSIEITTANVNKKEDTKKKVRRNEAYGIEAKRVMRYFEENARRGSNIYRDFTKHLWTAEKHGY